MTSMTKTLLALSVLMIMGCATKQVAVQARFPAAYPDATALKRISVLGFKGSDGIGFADQLTAELKAANLDGQLIFAVMSKDMIKGRTGDIKTAMSHGRALGVQGVYYGQVDKLNIVSRNWKQERTKCLEYKNFFKCKKSKKIKVTCHEQLATYTAQPKLVNVLTGDIVYTESISSSSKNQYCSDSGRKYSKAEFNALLRKDVAAKVRRRVAPFNGVFNVQLKNDTKGLAGQDKDKFSSGLSFSDAGQMDRACAIWQELSALSRESNNNISLVYNLGVCAEVVADYDRALELYSKADSMLTAPDKLISGAKERALKLKMNDKAI
ncbi:MAG: hypothetical protein DBP03_09805 [gamma proteobacterium symbiont of Ctena orbiculata]|nr:MAG: hypothetical protein DBP03_09805 [gamma proteobacterium symbiont of Ctena orbiculata]